MDEASLEMLEFPRIREMLAEYTSFALSHERALALMPSSDYTQISLQLERTAQARRLLALKPEFYISTAHDIRPEVMMAAKGKMLDAAVLVKIASTLAAVRMLRSSLSGLADELPLLWEIASGIADHHVIEKEIDRCIAATGEIADAASGRLAQIRRGLRDTRQRILQKLEAMMKARGRDKFIQETYITERDGRYVVPVKAEYKKEIKGIVHDISNTGATVFIEPWTTVETGNELRQLVIEEKQEVERILQDLSDLVGANAAEVCCNLELLAEIDFTVAKARFAQKMNACEPVITPPGERVNKDNGGAGRVLRLVKARHPLLKGKAVPLDIQMGDDYSILIITGPNTGGKTVALKTIGLLTVMAQSGLPVPADTHSTIPIFDNFFADIGDQQSIEQTLSTFSWHMGNIIHIIDHSTSDSLVLLDELGISTDPDEGSALARAVLLHFLAKRTLLVATTHYSDLKVFAHGTEGMKNASMDFDPLTLAPTYHMTLGVPGGSNALSIAAQLGLPGEIIERAKSMMSQQSRQMEDVLADLLREKQRYQDLALNTEQENRRVRDLRVDMERQTEALKQQEQTLVKDIRNKLMEDAAGLQRAIYQAEVELRKEKKRKSIDAGKQVLDTVYEKLEDDALKLQGDVSDESEITAGDTVQLLDNELEGVVAAFVGDKQLEIRVGNTSLTVNRDRVVKLAGKDSEKYYPPSGITRTLARGSSSMELDLRGRRADEVEGELDRYLNDAFLCGYSSVRIIHGYATGTLRRVVREILSMHSLVKGFRAGEKEEGGDGVTIAKL